jgi:polysaccharide export outer membrane protein
VNKNGLPKDTVVRTYDQATKNYRIQPNDAIYVRFQSLTEEEFDFLTEQTGGGAGAGQNVQLRSELVDPQGYISFPVINKFKAAGMTVFELQDTLQHVVTANQYLNNAVVRVRLVNFRFTLLGEVGQEGTYVSANNRISLPEALGLGGGAGELANRREVKIIRQHDGRTDVAYVDLLDENLMASPYYYVWQNDVIVVPPLRQRPFRKYFTQNVSIILSAASVILLIINLSNN